MLKINHKILYEIESVRKELDLIDVKVRRLTIITAWVSMVGLTFSYLDNEIYFMNNGKDGDYNTALRTLSVLLTIILVGLIYKFYAYQVQEMVVQKQVHPETTVFQTKIKNWFLIELCINIIVYPPFLNLQISHNFNELQYNIPLNAYIFLFMLGRLYILLRIFQRVTLWNSQKAQRVCMMNDFNANFMFTIRVKMKTSPFTLVAVVLVTLILVFGVAIRNIEHYQNTDYRAFQFDNIFNCFWCIVLSMTTIGYGDIFPISVGGRFIVILAGISGFLILSMLVNIIQAFTLLRPSENQAYEYLVERQKVKKYLRQKSCLLIQRLYRLHRLRKLKKHPKERMILYINTHSMKKRLRLLRLRIKSNKLSLSDILIQIGQDYDHEISKIKEEIDDLQDLKDNVEQCVELQRSQNSIIVQMYKNQKLIQELASQSFSEQFQG